MSSGAQSENSASSLRAADSRAGNPNDGSALKASSESASRRILEELSADKFGGHADQANFSNRQPLDQYMPETAKLVNKFYEHHLSLD
ncbi:MAG: hypothetical protein P4L53_26385 [Candidatus Obscuribacterales bacterium]|nr:hypothetical protein [Candidatus Obscuribacterales bacterium]